MIIQGISAFFASAAFAILFYLPKKYILHAGMTGSFCWFIYLIVNRITEDKVLATFAATLVVAITSHILARVLRTPVTLFLIPGIICLVPGGGMYQIVQSFIESNNSQTQHYFNETLQIAGAIALGIFIVDTLFRKSTKRK